jgi:hypothetical protein
MFRSLTGAFALSAVLAGLMSGCTGSSGSTTVLLVPSPPAASPISLSVNDVSRIVSAGNSNTFNNLTANANDIALNPLTQLPSLIYYDKQQSVAGTTAVGALKYAYMDATGAWNIEVVDANFGPVACGTAGSFCVGAPNIAAGTNGVIMKLAFKSDGTPGIAYVYGASVTSVTGYKQIRFAERSTSGAWSISVAFASPATGAAPFVATQATVDPMKAVTLNFDSADRPEITFDLYTFTITSSSTNYLFRTSAGAWLSSTIMAGIVSGAGTITALGQGDNQHGAALCPSTGRLILTTTEVTAAAGAGMVPRYIRCSVVDPITGACTTWLTQNLMTGCTGVCLTGYTSNIGTRSDLIVDPNTSKPLIGIYSTTTPANTLGTLLMPNTCDLAQPTGAAWGAPATVGNANQGQFGFRMGASATNFYIGFLTAGTDVRMSLFSAGSWFANGHIVETVTTNTNNEGVGFAYDATNDRSWVSYGSNTAGAQGAVGNDIKVATAQTTELVTGGLAGTLLSYVVDNLYSFAPAAAVPLISSAIASNGTVGYAYFFQDALAIDSRLYYGIRGGVTTAPAFGSNIVTSHVQGGASPLFVGSYPSLAYDSSSNPVIAFYNGVVAEQNLNVARSSNGGASFDIQVVDARTSGSANIGQYPSAATSGNAIGVSYYDVTNKALKFARWTAAGGWRRFIVDGMAGTGSCAGLSGDYGKYSKLAFTSTGTPVIAYQANGALRLAYAANALTSSTYTWTCLSIDSGGANRGEGIDMVLSSDAPQIAHFDSSAGSVRYVASSVAVTAPSFASGSFSAEVVAGTGTTSNIVTIPSFKINALGTRYIAFYSANFQALALANKSPTAGAWTVEYIDQPGAAGGSYQSAAGQYASLLINTSGYPMAFYRSRENYLKYFSREVQ